MGLWNELSWDESNSKVVYSQISNVIISGIKELSQFGTGTGRPSINGRTLKRGNYITIINKALMSTGIGQKSTLKFKINSQVILDSTIQLPDNLINSYSELDIVLLVKETGEHGKLIIEGKSLTYKSQDHSIIVPLVVLDPIEVNTNKRIDLDLTYKWETLDRNNLLKIQHLGIFLI